MSSLSVPGPIENVPIITQLRRALDGDVAALGEVVETILDAPEGFVENLRTAVLDEKVRKDHATAHREPIDKVNGPLRLSADETQLLQKINEGLPEETWKGYNLLRDRLDAEVLTPEEQRELLSLSNQVETMHAQRLALVWELAKIRGKSLEAMMVDLGMVSPGVR